MSHSSPRNRPWLLLWLLPYLLFSVASDGLHSHDWRTLATVQAITQTSGALAGTGLASSDLTNRVTDAAHAECFACDWAANSASQLVAPAMLALTHTATIAVTPFQFTPQTPPSCAWHIRGPPLA